jgi:hypothetical protein
MSYRDECLEKARSACSVAERQKWEGLAARGEPPSLAELDNMRAGAWSVAERQFYESRISEIVREAKKYMY